MKSVEIICSECGADALLVRTPQYDGFTKTGESLSCSACGHVYESEEDVPYKGRRQVRVFTEADRSKNVEVFAESEAEQLCRYCANYVINPFLQWCSLHKKEVEATDTCKHFERKEEEAEETPEEPSEETPEESPEDAS